MLNVIELENRWKKYKIKSYIPYFIILIAILLAATFFIFFTKPEKKQVTKIEKKTLIKPVHKNIIQKEILVKKTKQKQKPIITQEKEVKQHDSSKIKSVILSPSLNFIDNIKYNYPTKQNYQKTDTHHYKNTKNIQKLKKENINKNDENLTTSIQKPETQPTITEESIKKVQNTTIQIKRQNTKKDITEVLKRFNKNNNPALSLFIAKKYYELKNYRQSYNYALITNGINDTIEPSWIIFAKSLVKLNKKDKAIETLKSYISHTNSNQAKILLEDIISGKFK